MHIANSDKPVAYYSLDVMISIGTIVMLLNIYLLVIIFGFYIHQKT